MKKIFFIILKESGKLLLSPLTPLYPTSIRTPSVSILSLFVLRTGSKLPNSSIYKNKWGNFCKWGNFLENPNKLTLGHEQSEISTGSWAWFGYGLGMMGRQKCKTPPYFDSSRGLLHFCLPILPILPILVSQTNNHKTTTKTLSNNHKTKTKTFNKINYPCNKWISPPITRKTNSEFLKKPNRKLPASAEQLFHTPMSDTIAKVRNM